MNIDLTGRAVAITGASSGIGEALARRITDDGGRAVAIPTDVTDEERAREFVERARRELGRLDVLVNNAGVMLLGPIVGAALDEWRRMIDVNVLGLLYCTHAVLPAMLEQGTGHIVNVSSVAGRFARSGSGVYNLTKFGVGAFSESLRQEVSGRGIRVTLVEPGAVETELREHNRPEIIEQMSKRYADVTPLAAQDIANAILYALGQPQNVSVSEMLVRPTSQTG